ncbi:hypothetical protein SAMN04487761_11139 [Lachnospiraceae bacterium C7]|nr:hypothetical protein SAMN04487761_11139 [Lachnospiraceae bacterium C7]
MKNLNNNLWTDISVEEMETREEFCFWNGCFNFSCFCFTFNW